MRPTFSRSGALVVEYNGDVYPCDFFVHPGWKLGSILSDSLRTMVESQERTRFIGQKHPLPAECQACEWKALCKGGCPRNLEEPLAHRQLWHRETCPARRANIATHLRCRHSLHARMRSWHPTPAAVS